MWKRAGIYKITNLTNGKFYIGSSTRFDIRKNTHWCQLRGGYHFNSHLQSSWNLYGEEVFKFEPIIICAIKDLFFYEQRLIDGLKPAYNKSPIAGSTTGRKASEETKKRISLAKKGVPHKNKRQKITFSSERRTGCARPGERHGGAKLTEADVQDIRKLLSTGSLYMSEIAGKFSVTVACIGDIKYKRSWKHLPCRVEYKPVSELRTGRKWSPKRRKTHDSKKD